MQSLAFIGLMLAYLGRKGEAIDVAEQATQLRPVTKDSLEGAYMLHQLARVGAAVGESERAVDILQQRVSMPYFTTRASVKLDPNFASLPGNPRFEQLVAGRQ